MEKYIEKTYEPDDTKEQNLSLKGMIYAVEAASLIFASPLQITGKILEVMIRMSTEDIK